MNGRNNNNKKNWQVGRNGFWELARGRHKRARGQEEAMKDAARLSMVQGLARVWLYEFFRAAMRWGESMEDGGFQVEGSGKTVRGKAIGGMPSVSSAHALFLGRLFSSFSFSLPAF